MEEYIIKKLITKQATGQTQHAQINSFQAEQIKRNHRTH